MTKVRLENGSFGEVFSRLSHPIANSSMLVFPMRTAPWSSSFWTTVALKGGT